MTKQELRALVRALNDDTAIPPELLTALLEDPIPADADYNGIGVCHREYPPEYDNFDDEDDDLTEEG